VARRACPTGTFTPDAPTGSTVFKFKAADLDFESDSYDWLVVTGSDYARFKSEKSNFRGKMRRGTCHFSLATEHS
jgi:hypothetical protein